MRPLLITSEIEAAVRAMCARARAHPVPLEWLQQHGTHDFQRNVKRPPGYEPPPTEKIDIPFGYHCCYNTQQQPGLLCGHLSISVDAAGKIPSVPAVDAIAALFGTSLAEANWVWMEEFAPNRTAVNLLHIIPTIEAPATKQ